MDSELKIGQDRAYKAMMSGANILLTGDAGTGKTYVLEKFINDSREAGKNVAVVAFTGMAAFNLRGITLHRWLRCGIRPLVFKKPSLPDGIENVDILIVDEISQVRRDLFEYLVKVLTLANQKRAAKGDPIIQLIVTGDFYQLAPVLNKEKDLPALRSAYGLNPGECYAFQSPQWNLCNFMWIDLQEVIRNENADQVEQLRMLREGNLSCIDYFNDIAQDDVIENAINLCARNKTAEEINNTELAKIKNPPKTYHSKVMGEVAESDKFTVDELTLKVGARVMIVVNDSNGMYVNGSLGNVVKMTNDAVFVRIDKTDDVVRIEECKWNIFRYKSNGKKLEEEIIGSFSQMPLKLAWAVTIHKSQGQTYDAINIRDMENIWGKGQLYVALSRVRNLENMHFNSPIRRNNVQTSESVKKFYDSIF